jgi:hypothetical protein
MNHLGWPLATATASINMAAKIRRDDCRGIQNPSLSVHSDITF